MDCRDLLLEIRIPQQWHAVNREMDRNGAERIEDDENDGHDASMSIALPI